MLKNCYAGSFTAQKMKFSIKDFFSKCDQIHSFLRFWSHLLKKSLIQNLAFCAVMLLGYIHPQTIIKGFPSTGDDTTFKYSHITCLRLRLRLRLLHKCELGLTSFNVFFFL